MGEEEYKVVFGKSREEAVAEAKEELKKAVRAGDKEKSKKLYQKLKYAFVGDDALWTNEVAANIMTSSIMLFLCVILAVTSVLFKSGFYIMNNPLFIPLMILCIVQMLTGIIIFVIYKGERPWLKYMLLTLICITIMMASAVLGYRSTISLVIPVVLSTRYLSEKLTRSISILSGVLMLISTIGSATMMVSPDLNVFPISTGTVVNVTTTLREALVSQDIVMGDYIWRLIICNYIPNLFQFAVVAFVCCSVAKRGHQTVLLQAEVSKEFSRIDTELNMATSIQANMLPNIYPAFPDRKEFSIYATMNPAKEVGGDFYDFFMVDKRHLAIVVADVSGKGVPAALFMMIGKTLIKDHTQQNADLGQVFTEVNDLLCESNSEGMFITAFEGILDLVTGEFRYVNAGHEIPCICRCGGKYEPYKIRPGFVLAGMGGVRYQAGSLTIQPGDKIFQYTDGVTEATDKNNRLFGMERMLDILNSNIAITPEELLPAMKSAIDTFVGEAPQFDDITMLSLEYREKMVESSI